jgi:hypothetical protein
VSHYADFYGPFGTVLRERRAGCGQSQPAAGRKLRQHVGCDVGGNRSGKVLICDALSPDGCLRSRGVGRRTADGVHGECSAPIATVQRGDEQMSRSRPRRAVTMAFALTGVALVCVAQAQSRRSATEPLVLSADFPPADARIWTLLQTGRAVSSTRTFESRCQPATSRASWFVRRCRTMRMSYPWMGINSLSSTACWPR